MPRRLRPGRSVVPALAARVAAYVRIPADGIARVDAPADPSAVYPHRVERSTFVSPPGVQPPAGRPPLTADVYLDFLGSLPEGTDR